MSYRIVLTKVQTVVMRDFPGGPGFENLPSNGEDAGSIPGWGTKIPHAVEPLSSCTRTTESTHHN